MADAPHVCDQPAVVTYGSLTSKPVLVSAKRTSGDIVFNNASTTAWNDFPVSMDLVLAAAAGDVIEVGATALWNNEAPIVVLDVATIVSGAPVNYFSTAAGTGDWGIGAWLSFPSGGYMPLGGGAQYTLVSGDISGGNVTLRIRYRIGTANTNKTLLADANFPFQWWAKNHRQ